MISIKLNEHSDFRTAVKNGVLYIELAISDRIHMFSPLDVGKVITVFASLYDLNTFDEIPCEVVEYFYRNNMQYVVAREISKNSLQQFEECCVP